METFRHICDKIKNIGSLVRSLYRKTNEFQEFWNRKEHVRARQAVLQEARFLWKKSRPRKVAGKVTFGFEGTKRNAYGLTTPTYACLDDFGGNREISDAKKALAGITIPATVDLQALFNLDNDNSTVTYAIVDNCDAAKATMAIADGILTISGLTDKTETSAVVSATQKGKIQFVNIPVEIDEEKASVNDVAVDADVRIFPVPATDRLNIRTAMTDYAVRIYATNGSLVMEQLGNNGSIAVPVNHLAKGVYILTIDNAQQSSRHRVVVKESFNNGLE